MRLGSTSTGWKKPAKTKRQVYRYSAPVKERDGGIECRITGSISLHAAYQAAQRALADHGKNSIRLLLGARSFVVTTLTTFLDFCAEFNRQSNGRKYPASALTMLYLK